MQLIQTKQYHLPSTEFYKRPLLIEHIESEPKISLPIDDLIRQFEEEYEYSLILKTIKDIELLENLYTFSNSIDVKRFLLKNKCLINILFEAYKQIKRIFNQNIVEICLEYDRDPEEDFEGLFVIIKTNLSPEESLNLLERFDEEWFLDNVSEEIGSIFTVTVRPG